jgi:hypothetical protein
LELGFGERLQQRVVAVARGEVQQRARDRRRGEAAVVGAVAGAQARAGEHLQARYGHVSPWRGQRDHRGRGRNDAPAPGRSPVTQNGAIAGGQQSRDEVSLLGEQLWRHHRVDAAMNARQPPRAHSTIDRVGNDARSQQLRPRHDRRLLARYRPNCRKLPPDSAGNLRQMGHAAIVDAPTVPAQHRCASTQRKNCGDVARSSV